jgi:carboxylesterase
VRYKRFANLINFPDIEPHGIKDDRVREFVRAALFSGDSTKAGLPYTPGGAVIEHRWLAGVTRRELKTINQPTLILHPRDDDYADLNNSWYLQRNLKGIVDMVVLDDCYHAITIDRQRHVVVERTLTFIETVTKKAKERPARPAPQKSMEDAPQTITVKAVAV